MFFERQANIKEGPLQHSHLI